MSDPKNISPLLDGFKLGAPICEHHGIVCCPAVRENTNKKYIVKVISVPANQAQLDALLLAGAYRDPADAMEYFRQKGESILAEAKQLKELSRLEGFLPYDGWQMEPITRHRLGYEVYLVGSYKRSLEKYMKKTAFTHLEAVNLALDLCSALSVCRQSGYIYADLKPSNVFVSEKKEFRIGDLGFLSMDSLRYASLPEQYHSPYTPPELLDPMMPINLSVDTYAVGMILYQLYNDGHLPFTGITPEQPVSTPIHADYEMAEIIMKAISPDPEQRWLDPKDLGKAIASYMQRNSINDIPITPFIPLDVVPEEVAPADSKKKRKKAKKAPQQTDTQESQVVSEGSSTVEDEADAADAVPMAEETAPVALEAAVSVDNQEKEDITPPEDPENEPVASDEELTAEETDVSDNEEPMQEVPAENPPNEEISIEEAEEIVPAEISEEVAKIITKADDLIAHEIPEDVIYPAEPEVDPFAFVREDEEESSSDEESLEEDAESESAPVTPRKTKHFADKSRGQKFRRFLGGLFGTAFATAVCVGGFWFYQNIYLQSVDSMTLTGTQDQITVLIDTSADESRLVIHCSDSKGNRITESVKGGKATFLNLNPSTQYTIEVESTGFHKLTGSISDVIKTESTTQILTFDAVAGSEDGSVVLEFTVEGGEPDFWNIRYSAEGENEKRETITNHSTMITGLTVGKLYTFTLDGGKDFDLSGNTQLQYMASKLILAEKISAKSDDGKNVTMQWKSPGDVVVDHWKVRCYDGYGYENELTVTDTQVQLSGLDPAVSYTVEVTASGMTQPARFDITADPVSISDFHLDESKQTKLNLSWEFTGDPGTDGWILMYTIDGSGSQILECPKAEASVMPLLPGATYNFTLQSADGKTVFNNVYAHTTVSAENFADNGMNLDDVHFDLLKTPAEEGWLCEELTEDSFTNTFTGSDSVSLAIRSDSTFYMPGYETKVLYVIRNSYGNVLPELVAEETCYWKTIWQSGDPKNGELNIPRMPSVPGDYILQLYFNGKAVTELNFLITE